MKISKQEYKRMADKASPPSPVLKDCLMAFWTGGLICAFAQGLTVLFAQTEMTEDARKTLVLLVLIAITAILTGIGVFDKLAKHAGAGTMVPITGFANSIVSPAMEHQKEGRILGTAAQMFKLAGPVIAFGVVSSVIYGIIYWIFLML